MKIIRLGKVFYFEYGILFDTLIIAGLLICNVQIYPFLSSLKCREDIKDITNTFISTCVSIGGFSLAALTIIITIRSNVMAKVDTKPTNALESLFQSTAYFRITRIFKHMILEQVISALALFITWLYFGYKSSVHLHALLFSSYILTTTISRLLYILFFVIETEKIQKKSRPNVPQSNY
jgi:hypothetical protein